MPNKIGHNGRFKNRSGTLNITSFGMEARVDALHNYDHRIRSGIKNSGISSPSTTKGRGSQISIGRKAPASTLRFLP